MLTKLLSKLGISYSFNFETEESRREEHAILRAWERFSIRLTPSDLETITAQLKKENPKPIKNKSRNRSVYEITYFGVPMKVLCNNTSKLIYTFLR